MASLADVITYMASAVKALNQLTLTLQNSFPQVQTLTIAAFNMTAANTLAVPAPLVTANSSIMLIPTNAAAATLQSGANVLYVSAKTVGTGFTVSTAGGGAAAGTETFAYQLLTV